VGRLAFCQSWVAGEVFSGVPGMEVMKFKAMVWNAKDQGPSEANVGGRNRR